MCHSEGGDAMLAVGCVVTITGGQTSPSTCNRTLSRVRRYLFERIQEYCREESKDVVCPDPSLLIHQPPEIHPVRLQREYALKHTKKMDFCLCPEPTQLLKPISRCTWHCILRRRCKAVGPGSMTLTIVICSRQMFVP